MSFSDPAPAVRKIPFLDRAAGAFFPSTKSPRADARAYLLSPLCGSNRNHGSPRLDVAQMCEEVSSLLMQSGAGHPMMERMEHHKKLAILVGGGPAPGINAVIGAATIRAALEGIEVLAIEDGFERIMEGDVDHVRPL